MITYAVSNFSFTGELCAFIEDAYRFVRSSRAGMEPSHQPVKRHGANGPWRLRGCHAPYDRASQSVFQSAAIISNMKRQSPLLRRYRATLSSFNTQSIYHNFQPLFLAFPISCLTAKSAIISSLPPPITIILKSLLICSTLPPTPSPF